MVWGLARIAVRLTSLSPEGALTDFESFDVQCRPITSLDQSSGVG